jgi:hypothetical protein
VPLYRARWRFVYPTLRRRATRRWNPAKEYAANLAEHRPHFPLDTRANTGFTTVAVQAVKPKRVKLLQETFTRGTIHKAEEYADMSLTKLRIKMIEKCSTARISGPFYQVETGK